MTQINSNERAGLALAALALTTATLAARVREGSLSIVAMREIVRDAHRLANNVAGFVMDEKVAEMADDFSQWQKLWQCQMRHGWKSHYNCDNYSINFASIEV